MPLVPAICTQCGAQITIDDTHEAGICEHCGTAFITEKAINKYTTNITNNYDGANINVVNGNAENYLKLAENALKGDNGNEALEYANKTLEINPLLSSGWILKMKAINKVATLGNLRIPEIINCGNSAIKNAEDAKKEEVEKEVYQFYLLCSNSIMNAAIARIQDVSNLNRMVSIGYSGIVAAEKSDSEIRNLYFNMVDQAILIAAAVPYSQIEKNEYFQKLIIYDEQLFVYLCNEDVIRLSIYCSQITYETLINRKKTLETIKQLLPVAQRATVSPDELHMSKRHIK